MLPALIRLHYYRTNKKHKDQKHENTNSIKIAAKRAPILGRRRRLKGQIIGGY
jgi:hypothetical protein